ncbi:MAG: nicotinamide-nucleotide adenylyltransferase [Thermoproteota archaeon]|nr:nicotinamide-nucleotide adenylyltransferase [Thermoproteota archaeon]
MHHGHIGTIKFASSIVKQLIIAVGSADKSHETRNPFTAGERIEMIKDSLDNDYEIDMKKILIIPVPDLGVHALWTRQIELLTPRFEAVFSNDPLTNILFRERGIKLIEPTLYRRSLLSATEIRSRIAKGKNWENLVTPQTIKVIQEVDGISRIRTIYAKKEGQSHLTS